MNTEGYPEVRLSTIGLLDENNKSSITVTVDVVYSSLVYKTVNDKYESDIAIEVQIQPDAENRPGKTELFMYSVTDSSPDIQHRQSVFTIERKIDVDPGYYTIYLTLIDQNSKKSTQRVAQTFILDPREEVTALTDIRLLGIDMDDSITEWIPITTYNVPGKIDFLKFIFQVTNNKKNNPLPCRLNSVNSKVISVLPVFCTTVV